MLRIGDRIKFNQDAVDYPWEAHTYANRPNLVITGWVSQVQIDRGEPPAYRIIWVDGKTYGVSDLWAEEWLEVIGTDEIGLATEKWEHYYFGEANEQ